MFTKKILFSFLSGLILAPFAHAQDPVLIHYWNFNDSSTLTAHLSSSYTLEDETVLIQLNLTGDSEIQLTSNTGQNFTGENARFGNPAGSHLRFNNPIGSTMTIPLPSTGFENLVFKYETRRSGSGANTQMISYSLNGTTFTQYASITVTETPTVYSLDFSDLIGAANNPNFRVRISFNDTNEPPNLAGNNRFDNITLEGDALAGTNLPPVIEDAPTLAEIAVETPAYRLNLNTVFTDPDEDDLAFSAESTNSEVVSASISNGLLTLTALKAGDASVTVSASDGNNPDVSFTMHVLAFPAAYNLYDASFSFTEWSAVSPAGTYPGNMIFLQSDKNDPGLDDQLLFAYQIPLADAADPIDAEFPYNAIARTRITGENENGITFINTGRGRDVGAAVVSLRTIFVQEADLNFLAGTFLPNLRPYNLRVRYRIGHSGAWSDLMHNGEVVEYKWNQTEGHTQAFTTIPLPIEMLYQEYVQLKFQYYYTAEVTSGARARIRLDDIVINRVVGNSVEGDEIPSQITLNQNYPNPFNPSTSISFNLPESGFVSLRVFDSLGREMATLINEQKSAGEHHATFNASSLSSGVYIYTLSVDGITFSRKMILMK